MNIWNRQSRRREGGMVLITSLLLLLVVTILALAMFRGVGLENRIAGNVMDKQRALQAAASSEAYAEQWLFNNVTNAVPTVCAASTFSAATMPTICSNPIETATDAASALVIPWAIGGTPVGYSYNPIFTGTTPLFPVSTSGGEDNFYQAPTIYVADLGNDATYANATDYQIDAWSYGGSTGTVAVVESIYQIRYIASGGGGP
jgi:type IV pilus assembly protein PilX